MLWKELFAVGVSCVGGGAPGDEDLHNGVAAQTVAAMDAAGDLPRGIEAGDRLILFVQHVTLDVYGQTAHGVVGGGGHDPDAEQHAVQLVGVGKILSVSVGKGSGEIVSSKGERISLKSAVS